MIHQRCWLKDLIYKPIAEARVEISPIHNSFISSSWEEAITETYTPTRVGGPFSPASLQTMTWRNAHGHSAGLLLTCSCLPIYNSKNGVNNLSALLAHGEFTVYTNSGDVWSGIDPVHDRIPMSPLLWGDQSSNTIWLDGGEYISWAVFIIRGYIFSSQYILAWSFFFICRSMADWILVWSGSSGGRTQISSKGCRIATKEYVGNVHMVYIIICPCWWKGRYSAEHWERILPASCVCPTLPASNFTSFESSIWPVWSKKISSRFKRPIEIHL